MLDATLRERLAGKRFGLVLSAGFFGFYGHAGFLQGLADAGLVPSAYAGTSAGGLVASFAAAGLAPAEISRLLLAQKRADFWDPDPLGALLLRRRHGFTGLLPGRKFRKLLERELPVTRIEQCPHPLLLVAANLTDGTPEVFTEGELAPRVLATCAYPGLFRAVEVDGKLLWDGGLVDKAPALALARSAHAGSLDALLVHYLPSRLREKVSGPLAYAQAMDGAIATLRADHFRLQLEAASARLPVYTVVSHLPAVSPSKLSAGSDALEAARRELTRALAEPPRPFAVR